MTSDSNSIPHVHQIENVRCRCYMRSPERRYFVNRCILIVQGHSRSSKSVPIESPCAISLVMNMNSVSHRLRDIATLFAVFLSRFRLKPPQGVFPYDIGYECWSKKLESLGTTRRWISHNPMFIFLHMVPTYDRQSDGRTAWLVWALMFRLKRWLHHTSYFL